MGDHFVIIQARNGVNKKGRDWAVELISEELGIERGVGDEGFGVGSCVPDDRRIDAG